MSEQDKASARRKRATFGVVFLTIFLDMVGFSVIFPLFPAMLDHYLERESLLGGGILTTFVRLIDGMAFDASPERGSLTPSQEEEEPPTTFSTNFASSFDAPFDATDAFGGDAFGGDAFSSGGGGDAFSSGFDAPASGFSASFDPAPSAPPEKKAAPPAAASDAFGASFDAFGEGGVSGAGSDFVDV